MKRLVRILWCGIVAAAVLVAGPGPARAVEYRLQVVSVHEESFLALLKPGELRDGAAGAGLDRLEARLDQGDFPDGAVLYDRHVQPAPEAVARAHGGTPLRVEVRQGGALGHVWDEVRWEGTPGEHSVWVVEPIGRQPQEIRRLALKGSGPMRQFRLYGWVSSSRPLEALSLPLSLVRFAERRGTVWQKYVSRALDLSHDVGVVVATNDDLVFPDRAYIYVRHADRPMTIKVVLTWWKRDSDREAPSFRIGRER